MESKYFSVILPLYNKESSVLDTVLSVLNQNHHLLELIVVDDGSTDKSVDRLSKISDPRMSIVRQANAGVSVARNVGADTASHEFLAFIDADDLWHPDFLNVMNALVCEMPSHHCFASRWLSWSREYTLPGDERIFDRTKVSQVDYIELSFEDVAAHICSTVVSKTSFINVGGFPEGVKHFEDQDFMCKIARKESLILYDQDLVFYVRDADNRACDRRSVQDMPPFFRENEALMATSPKPGTPDWHFKEFLISRYLSEVSLAAQTAGERNRALRWLWLCRKTQKSKIRFIKGVVYMLLPRRALSYLVSKVSRKKSKESN